MKKCTLENFAQRPPNSYVKGFFYVCIGNYSPVGIRVTPLQLEGKFSAARGCPFTSLASGSGLRYVSPEGYTVIRNSIFGSLVFKPFHNPFPRKVCHMNYAADHCILHINIEINTIIRKLHQIYTRTSKRLK